MTWVYKGASDGDLTMVIVELSNGRHLFIYGDGEHNVMRDFNSDHLLADPLWEVLA